MNHGATRGERTVLLLTIDGNDAISKLLLQACMAQISPAGHVGITLSLWGLFCQHFGAYSI
jgi:hypothetical protein